ncbi:hypothetical protein BDBG_03216 [Blastomyces gilchristii SLH14081]|uniref:Uncharacterized protein n=1 Tax=Blastomyces gilchristii (strain SLH14081) TaxID=559298 RepID=A0A179UGE1_BLAGS|nr:uncharacterized protein BDBG_03216 [Blastomyces gilchristii SLH14081]OAT07116.1 hypothetical protein BDBG_03216 [Blastomyces gilchristii SLH14081]
MAITRRGSREEGRRLRSRRIVKSPQHAASTKQSPCRSVPSSRRPVARRGRSNIPLDPAQANSAQCTSTKSHQQITGKPAPVAEQTHESSPSGPNNDENHEGFANEYLPPNSSPMGGDKIPHVNDEDGEIISVAEEARSNADGNSDAGEGEDIIPLNEWSTRFCPDDGEIEILRFIWDPSCVTPAHFDDPEQADRRLDEMLKQGAYDDSPVGCQSKLLERVCSVYSKSSNDFGNLYSVTWRPYWSRKLSR